MLPNLINAETNFTTTLRYSLQISSRITIHFTRFNSGLIWMKLMQPTLNYQAPTRLLLRGWRWTWSPSRWPRLQSREDWLGFPCLKLEPIEKILRCIRCALKSGSFWTTGLKIFPFPFGASGHPPPPSHNQLVSRPVFFKLTNYYNLYCRNWSRIQSTFLWSTRGLGRCFYGEHFTSSTKNT